MITGLGRKKRGAGLAIITIIGIIFISCVYHAGATNVTIYPNLLKIGVNITNANNLYSYEINFANPGGGSSATFSRILGSGGSVTSGTNFKSGVFSVYESRLQEGWAGVNFSSSGRAVFNLTNTSSAILRQGIFVYANGTEETINFCTENLSCGNWGVCINGQQTRACNDLSGCLYGHDTQIQRCGGGDKIICTPSCGTSVCGMDPICGTLSCGSCDSGKICSGGKCIDECTWNCTEWGECGSSGFQFRSCLSKPSGCKIFPESEIKQICNFTCIENWNCGSWETCTNNQQTRICEDDKSCGTTLNRPPLAQSCNTTCPNAQVVCSEWSSCSMSYGLGGSVTRGEQTRSCHDTSGCLPDNVETKPCSLAQEINSTITREGNNLVLKLFDTNGSIVGEVITSETDQGKIKFDIKLFSSKISLSFGDYYTIDYTWFDILLWLLLLLILLIFAFLYYRKNDYSLRKVFESIKEKFNFEGVREFYWKIENSIKSNYYVRKSQKTYRKIFQSIPNIPDAEMERRNKEIRQFFTMKNLLNKRK